MGIVRHKEREYPIRYQLSPEGKRELADRLRGRKQITASAVKTLATHYHCSPKVIQMTASELKVAVVPDAPVKEKKAPQPCVKKPAHVADEALFKKAEPIPEPAAKREALLEGDALEALIEMEDRMKAEHDEALASLSLMEKDMVAAQAEAERQRERAEAAIQQTKKLRLATREEREKADIALSTIGTLNRKYARLAGKAKWLYGELAASVRREEALLEALAQSEADLARCKEECEK